MSWLSWAYAAVVGRRTMPIFRRLGGVATASVLAALVHGCTAPPVADGDASAPSARTRAVDYRSTIAPYQKQRPAEPASWEEQNRRVTPAPKP